MIESAIKTNVTLANAVLDIVMRFSFLDRKSVV